MENKIPQKSFDEQMHIIRDVHFDINKYKVGELYVINQKDPNYLSVQDKTVAQLTEAHEHELKFKVLVMNHDLTSGDLFSTYYVCDLSLTIDDIIKRQIEIERLMTETEAVVYLTNAISKECAKNIIPDPSNEKPVLADKYNGDLSQFTTLLGINAYKFPNKENPQQHTKNDDIMKLAEEEKKNYAILLNDPFSGMSKSFSILDSEGDFDQEPFKGLTIGSGRVLVKLVKGNSKVQFNVNSKYIKVTSDAIIITGNKSKSSIFMTLMRDNFREMFDKIEFEQIL
jgi:hypothetical protein